MLGGSIVTVLLTHTCMAHKEVRFIYVLLPMFHVLAAKPLVAFMETFPMPKKNYRLVLLVIAVLLNLSIAYYTAYVHQRGVIDVMHYLRHEYESKLESGSAVGRNMTVGFLMPCHSTPWRSHLVYPDIKAWALTCEPPLGLSALERMTYLDEADVFYADPRDWMRQNKKSDEAIYITDANLMEANISVSLRAWPNYLVFFAQLEPLMKKELHTSKYRECWRGFNTHWHDDWRRKGDVIVWCTNSY